MVICAVYGCCSRSGRADSNIKFFRFPSLRQKYTPDELALVSNRRALWILRICRQDLDDAKVTRNDSRVCSSHFVSGAPSALQDTSNPDWAPSINLGHDYFDGKRKLRKRKPKNSEQCGCLCDSYIFKKKYKKYKRTFKNIYEENEVKGIKTINEDVKIMKHIEGKRCTSSTITSESSSDSDDFNLTFNPGSTIITYEKNRNIIKDAHIGAKLSKDDLSTVISTGNVSSTVATLKEVPSPFISEIQSLAGIKPEESFSDDNLESAEENDLHESHSKLEQKRFLNSISEPKNSNTPEQINCVTHKDAFCAAETLLHYMMNQDDVNNSDISFILNLTQKIKERLSMKKEIISENL